jgi:hypothetical protein
MNGVWNMKSIAGAELGRRFFRALPLIPNSPMAGRH